MNYISFLERNDQLKFELLEHLLDAPNRKLPIKIIISELHESRYKLKKIFDELTLDLKEFDNTSSLILTEDVLTFSSSVTIDLRKFQLFYLKKSILFRVFQFEYMESHASRHKFLEDNFISQAQFYNIRNQVNQLVADLSMFSPARSVIQNGEFIKRLSLIDLYQHFFNGIEDPFPALNALTSKFMNLIAMTYSISLSPVKFAKLNLFLQVQLARILNGHGIGNLASDVQYENSSASEAVESFFQNHISISNDQVSGEVDFLLLFLESQEFVGAPVTTLSDELQDKFKTLDTQLGSLISSYFERFNEDQFPAMVSSESEIILSLLNMRLLIFDYASTRMISSKQLKHYQKLYPLLDIISREGVEVVADIFQLDLDGDNFNRLYSSYFFTLLAIYPIEKADDTISIYVDFSQGRFFTDYVRRVIKSYVNLEVTDKLTPNTDIYLSDSPIKKIGTATRQLIWDGLPNTQNWLDLSVIMGQIIESRRKQSISHY